MELEIKEDEFWLYSGFALVSWYSFLVVIIWSSIMIYLKMVDLNQSLPFFVFLISFFLFLPIYPTIKVYKYLKNEKRKSI